MAKLLVERPRVRGSEAKGRHKELGEDAPLREKIKPINWVRKELNENLAPLRRFLYKQVGRPWNKIYAELHEHIKVTSAVQAHILQHVDGYVERNVMMINGVPHTVSYGGLRKLGSYRNDSLYVDPTTGILRVLKHEGNKTEKKKRAAAEAAKLKDPREDVVVNVRHDLSYSRIQGIWYKDVISTRMVRVSSFQFYKTINGVQVRLDTPAVIWKTEPHSTTTRTQLGSKEIKRLGLKSGKLK